MEMLYEFIYIKKEEKPSIDELLNVDGVTVDELKQYLRENKDELR